MTEQAEFTPNIENKNNSSKLLQEFSQNQTKLREYQSENGYVGYGAENLENNYYDSYNSLKRNLDFEEVLQNGDTQTLVNFSKFLRADIYETRRMQEDETSFIVAGADALSELSKRKPENDAEDDELRYGMRCIFEGYKNIGDDELAREAILESDLDKEEKLKLVVEYANVNGFMNTVHWLSKEKSDPDMEYIYRQLQSDDEEIVEVLEGWIGVYEGVDITKWYDEKLTPEEIDDFENWVRKYGDKEPKKAKIVDVAAGMGRHTKEMVERGYENVTAAEFKQDYVDHIKGLVGDSAEVKQANWLSLVKDLNLDPGSVDAILLEGRSIMHNATVEQMLQTFDQIQLALSQEGIAVVDFADPEFGKYIPKVEKMRKNFKRLKLQATPENLIFDGPNPERSFNRLALGQEHVKALTSLVGLKVVEQKRTEKQVHGAVGNIYYVLQKDSDFDPAKLTKQQVQDALKTLGYFNDPTSSGDASIKAWDGRTINQSYLENATNIKEYVEDGVVYMQGNL